MKHIFATALGAVLLTAVIWLPMPMATGYSYRPREVRVRTTAYTHTESDHIAYGRKTALGTNLKFSREYTSAASDWSRFPVGTEFRIKGLNRHFVIDDYGSALVGKDTIDLYFTSKTNMNRWGARYVDIIVTKYGDYEKSKEILSQRTKYRHCRKMLAGIKENEAESKGGEDGYETVPPLDFEIDEELLAAASIPKNDWSKSAPELIPDPRQPSLEPELEPEIQFAEWYSYPPPIPAKPMEVATVTDRTEDNYESNESSPNGIAEVEIVEPPLPPDSEWAGPIRTYAFQNATVQHAIFVKPTPTTRPFGPGRRSFRKIVASKWPWGGKSTTSKTVSVPTEIRPPSSLIKPGTEQGSERKTTRPTQRELPITYRKPRSYRPL